MPIRGRTWTRPRLARRARRDEEAEEREKVIVRSNGVVTYVGKDIAYRSGNWVCSAATSSTANSSTARDIPVACHQTNPGELEHPALIVLALAGSGRAGAQARPRAQESLDQSRRTAIVTSAARVSPSVVSVGVVGRRRVQQSPFDMFFAPEGNEQQVQSFGTGFVVRADGDIITNQHVVAGADSITVTLPTGPTSPATLVGEDPTTDIAVLRVDRRNLAVVALGRSTDLMIGEWVVALGNPYAFLLGNGEPTVTAGVVSATGRNILPNRRPARVSTST